MLFARQELHSKQITLLLEVETGHFPGLFPKWQECHFLPLCPTCLREWLVEILHNPDQIIGLKKTLSMICHQNILPNRKRRKQVEEKEIPSSINLPFPWKNLDYFSPWLPYSKHLWFELAQHPSSPSPGIITRIFPHLHSSPSLRSCDSEGEGPPVILPLPGHWGRPLAPLLPTCLSIPLTPVISSRTGMGSKWITWDSGIWVEYIGKEKLSW